MNTSQQDKANPPPHSPTLFPEPSLQEQVGRLAAELKHERVLRRELEKQLRNLHAKTWAYKGIDDVYKSLKQAAEYDAQAPIDEHYRDVLGVLDAIASDETACSCHARSWRGEGHDTQCPIRIATDTHPILRQARERAKEGVA
jgi:hypothetical protein